MKSVLAISFALMWCMFCHGQVLSQPGQSGIRIMFYNVENFFDIYNDTLTDDDDFLPQGVMRWNYKRYSNKLNSLYKTIIAAGEWEPPSIIGFCEIENKRILEDLIFNTYLTKFKYGIIHEESPDRRGIDVCLIYRKEKVCLITYKYWIPSIIKSAVFNSRSVLYSKFFTGKDTIHLIFNHWPSRRGGVLEGESARSDIASMVRAKIDSLLDSRADAKIIIAGDFNCTPRDEIIKSMINSSDSARILINLSEELENKGSGTYVYTGTWEMIDQLMVTKNILTYAKGNNMLTIFKPDFLIKKDPKYPGYRPFSTYFGYKYQGGFSDHLPILLDLKFSQY
jgi:predicted extracellular nuclease